MPQMSGPYPNCCAKNGTQIEQAFDRAAGGRHISDVILAAQ